MRCLGVGIKGNHRGQDGRLTMQESFRVDMLRGRDGTGLATGDNAGSKNRSKRSPGREAQRWERMRQSSEKPC